MGSGEWGVGSGELGTPPAMNEKNTLSPYTLTPLHPYTPTPLHPHNLTPPHPCV
ncbi:MAG: hypothetical protein DSM106950_00715 [Stigonema ocellatum SAG 48.90 = DSM 106950]|nr:hypothetical protein [Stigonema ocellatum SAG 48.90 = DSM 106950]